MYARAHAHNIHQAQLHGLVVSAWPGSSVRPPAPAAKPRGNPMVRIWTRLIHAVGLGHCTLIYLYIYSSRHVYIHI